MYEDFFKLTEKPFSRTPDPRFLYHSKRHGEALARLQHAVEEQEFALLTGDIGSGKTTLSRALIDSLDGSFVPVLIINPRLSPSQLLRTIALRLGSDDRGRFRHSTLEAIHAKLFEVYESGRRTAIIIDEAQLIPGKSTFEELRLLTNFQLDNRNLMALVLIGQTELAERLGKKSYRALRQRIGLQCYLSALDLAETREYIRHRLAVAGRAAPLFNEAALGKIHACSAGVPRVINIIAGNSLIEAFGRGALEIGPEVVEDVVRDGV